MKPFTQVRSRVAPLLADNIDTDQIIPARFLKVTESQGLGTHLFEDLRKSPDGSPKPDFFMNSPVYAGAAILLAGRNFGCGSSREHAPWALAGWGIRVVLASSFADIFRANAMKNGLLPVILGEETLATLWQSLTPEAVVTVDLARQIVTWPGGSAQFAIDPFSKTCLLEGVDQLSYIMKFEREIALYEARGAQERLP